MTVNLFFVDESDFSTTPTTVYFPASPGSQVQRRKCITIQITDDHLPEEDESFTLSLSLQGGDFNDLRILPDRTTIIIQDNGDC